MKALVKNKAERGLWLEDIAEPTIGINDVPIRVRYTGIRGTDVHIYQWDEWAQKTIPVPMAIGHEFVGEVIFNMLTIKGIYGRQMYETWYKMSVMLESGVDISPVITHCFPYSEFQHGFDAMISRQTGKVVPDWTSLV
jgi:threonine dehydrogenase-like Zn-dependent dehydrogenase